MWVCGWPRHKYSILLTVKIFWPYQAYSNRAACYTKLGALPEGLKDAEKCIELDPTFSKGYTRKGAVQFFMKEYEKALDTYQEGLKHDPNNQELLDGARKCVAFCFRFFGIVFLFQQYLIINCFSQLFCRCVQQINKASRGDLSPEELKERQVRISFMSLFTYGF